MKKITLANLTIVAAVLVSATAAYFYTNNSDDNSTGLVATEILIPTALENSQLKVDYSQSSIELTDILSGGPGKDGIPALTDPGFVQIGDSEESGSTQVIVVDHNGEQKIYPYSILVWHEIVNDTVGGKPLAITFCPLCGSAIVFDREVNGEVLDFGVSGFLNESNLLLYDRSDSESLWSQSRGEAVVGAKTGTKLVHAQFTLTTYGDAVRDYPNATVLSTNTGHSRDYTATPYSGYSDTDQTSFPVSVSDERFPAKEIFYIVPIEGNSIAMQLGKEDGVYEVPDSDIKITLDKGTPIATWGDAELPGYYEMWFSWATHNQENGIVL